MNPSDILPESVATRALLAIIVVSVIFVRIFTWLGFNSKLRLPGPYCWPVFGYLPFLGKLPHETLHKLTEKYGSIFGVYLGNRYVVVLGGYTAMKEAFSKSEFLFRPEHPPMSLAERKMSMSSINGEHWKEQRKFILQQLKDLGLGKSIIEESVAEEIQHFLKEVDKAQGHSYDFRSILPSSIINNIMSLVFGRRLEYDDPKRVFLSNSLTDMLSVFSQTATHCFMPWTTPFLVHFDLMNYNRGRNAVRDTYRFVLKEIQEHKKSVDNTCIRDFVDGFLMKMEGKDIGCNSSFTMDMLNGNAQSLLSAGSEPVIATIEWCLVILADYQDVQKKLYDEIDRVIGKERMPCWNDRSKMFYTQAVIKEVQRWKTPTPINLLRSAEKDAVIQGYNIPKGTVVLANLWGIHNDKKYWDNPNLFNPKRFLNEDETGILKKDSYAPFSTGKRACPGEALAHMEVFLYVTSIFQSYEVSFPKGCAHDLQGYGGISYRPFSHNLCFTKRM